ncbi:MAG: trehalose-6-phosphate synthase [Pseudomonadota bacterium]|nr:trehalose-6-phosphate synthase [Pseudomonadota bacterium]
MLHADNPTQLQRWLAALAAYSSTQAYSRPLHRPAQREIRPARLVVISNRVSAPRTHKASAGGLAVAMSALLAEHGGIWLGWSGKTADAPQTHTLMQGRIATIVQDLSPGEHEAFYMRFCNATLWPLLHYNIGLSDFDRSAWEAYIAVNRRYAELVASILQPDDLIWVHDFHFLPLAAELRRLGVTNRIGFFLHTPFPAREVLLTLPVHKELVAALYAYDVAGFQTRRDLEAFRDYAGPENLRAQADAFARPDTLFAHFPIGIQTHRFARAARKSLTTPDAEDLQASLSGRQLILGVDRLDYSKGIVQRLKAIGDLLDRDGKWQKQFTFLQISPPTREGLQQYEQLRAEVESLVGHINGKFTHIDWVPIRFLARGMRRDLLAAFYRLARIGLVTPLRDGMNLIAKEFVAAQDPEDPGVLVLSSFAGAAEELQQALLVNPYDTHEIADTVERALTMPLKERQDRWRAMFDVISRQTLEKWYQDYMEALAGTP